MSLLFLIAFLLVMAPGWCSAGGILHVFPPTHEGESYAVARPEVLVSKTLITVSESEIEYQIDQTFFNDNDFPLKGVFLLPIERDADSSSAEVRINGMTEDSSIVAPPDFFPILRELTVEMKDPSLLGLAGKHILKVSPLNIGARQQVASRVQYKRPLLLQKDELELAVPLAGERYALGPVGQFEVVVRFKMSRRVAGIFSDSHHVSTVREAPHRCVVSTRAEHQNVRTDFHLLTTFGSADLDFRIFTHRPPERKGIFMAMLVPPVSASESRAQAKDVVFVLDISGSPGASEFEFAKRVLLEGVTRLAPRDRFNIVSIGSRVQKMANRLAPVDHETICKAVQYVGSIMRTGGTDVYNGFLDSLDQLTSTKRSCFIMFVGRGRATVGITKPEAIIDATRRDNKVRARFFALGLGEQADIALLDKMATSNRGGFFHAKDPQQSQAIAEEFLSRVSPPLLTDLSLNLQGLSSDAMHPDPIPDIFSPEGRTVLGRYAGDTDISARVRFGGKAQGRTRMVTQTVGFPLEDRQHPFLPAVWAMRETARLLERDRLKGTESGAREEAKKLAKEFGFKLPATLLDASPQSASGEREFASLLWLFKTSNVVSDVIADGIRTVEDKVFRFDKTGWTDMEEQGLLPIRPIAFLSDDYFSLVQNRSQLGTYLALGPDITLVLDKEVLRIKASKSVR